MSYRLLSKYRSELMGLAMMSVMFFHMTRLALSKGLAALRSVGYGGVDVFVLLSGMGLAMSLLRRPQPFGEYLSRRARRILPAYYVVMIPYTAALMTAGRARLSAIFWNSVLLYYWENPTGKFNWYVAGIMVLYLMAPPIVRFMGRFRRREIPALLVALLGVAITMLLVFDNDYLHQDLSMRIPIFGMGCMLGFYIHEEKPFRAADGMAWAATFALGLLYLRIHRSFGFYLPQCFVFIFVTVPLCLALSGLFELAGLPHIRAALRAVGESSLEIYLLNVSLFQEHDFIMGLTGMSDGRLYSGACFLANIALGMLLHRVMETAERNFAKRRETIA